MAVFLCLEQLVDLLPVITGPVQLLPKLLMEQPLSRVLLPLQPLFAAGLGTVPLPSLWVVLVLGVARVSFAATADPLPRGTHRGSRLGGFGPGPSPTLTQGTAKEQ